MALRTTDQLIRSERLATVVYNALLATTPLIHHRTQGLWRKAWALANRSFSGPVTTRLYGYPVHVNFGNTYPLWGREHATYNNSLMELVSEAHAHFRRPMHFVDVGAAIGDTVLMLKRNCSRMVGRFTCIDADDEFLRYLRANLEVFNDVDIVEAMLSDREGTAPSLVRVHPGTSRAAGTGSVPSTTLDSIMASRPRPVDVLKTDVDGFDGSVLSGSRKVLEADQPYVFFEWTPEAYEQTGNDWQLPFRVLTEAGYDRFVWFTKLGKFSHFMYGHDERLVASTAAYCLENTTSYDVFFDVAALAREHSTSPVRLADLRYARNCTCRY